MERDGDVGTDTDTDLEESLWHLLIREFNPYMELSNDNIDVCMCVCVCVCVYVCVCMCV